jgi:NitT/TauT family transport system substrate-binding protein
VRLRCAAARSKPQVWERQLAVEKVRIGVATPPGMTAANGYFSAASALGYDEKEGLRFKMYYGEEPGATARALFSGDCDIASLNTTVGLLGHEEGLPLKAVYGKARRTHRWFAVIPESPIHSLVELKGKVISCDFPHLQPLAEAALAEEGVPRGTYRWAQWRGSGMQTRGMLEPLRRGDVDAVFLIDWNAGDFVAEGLPLRRLPSKALDRIRLSSCLWVSESYLARNPNAIVGTGRALAKGTVFALENLTEPQRWEEWHHSMAIWIRALPMSGCSSPASRNFIASIRSIMRRACRR